MHIFVLHPIAFKFINILFCELRELEELDEDISIAKEWVQECHRPDRKSDGCLRVIVRNIPRFQLIFDS